jgi:hypothetical protein
LGLTDPEEFGIHRICCFCQHRFPIAVRIMVSLLTTKAHVSRHAVSKAQFRKDSERACHLLPLSRIWAPSVLSGVYVWRAPPDLQHSAGRASVSAAPLPRCVLLSPLSLRMLCWPSDVLVVWLRIMPSTFDLFRIEWQHSGRLSCRRPSVHPGDTQLQALPWAPPDGLLPARLCEWIPCSERELH